MNADFERVKTTDPVVKKVLEAGGSVEDCVVALVRHADELRGMFGDFEIGHAKLMQLPGKGIAKRPELPPDRT